MEEYKTSGERLKFKLQEIRWYLEATYNFSSTSRGVQDNINTVLDIIDDIEKEFCNK